MAQSIKSIKIYEVKVTKKDNLNPRIFHPTEIPNTRKKFLSPFTALNESHDKGESKPKKRKLDSER